MAQGRVWMGSQAKDKGLVDKLGGLDAALKAAAGRAGLTDYDVSYVEKPLSPRDQLLSKLLDNGEDESDGVQPGSRRWWSRPSPGCAPSCSPHPLERPRQRVPALPVRRAVKGGRPGAFTACKRNVAGLSRFGNFSVTPPYRRS